MKNCPLLAVLICFALCAVAPAEPVGVITALRLPATLIRGGESMTARLGDEVHVRDMIQTGIGGRAKILFKDDVMIFISENTAVEISRHLYDLKRGWRDSIFDLRKGMIRSMFEKYTRDSSFIVDSGNAIAGAKGTDFLVRYSPDEELTQVWVFAGLVEVRSRLAKEALPALLKLNSMTEVKGSMAPAAARPLSDREAAELKGESSFQDEVRPEARKELGPSGKSVGVSAKPKGLPKVTGVQQPFARPQNPQVSVVGQDFIPPSGAVLPSASGPAAPAAAPAGAPPGGGGKAPVVVGPAGPPAPRPPVPPPLHK